MKTYNWEEIKDRKCRGQCLNQTYYYCYIRVRECHENCQLVKCPNYALCGHTSPEWFYGCHSERCNYCNEEFGKTLEIVEEKHDCPICLEEKTCFVRWGCPHLVCVECFKTQHKFLFDIPICDCRIITKEEETELAEAEAKLVEAETKAKGKLMEEEVSSEEYIPVPKNLKICPICRHEEIPHWMKSQKK